MANAVNKEIADFITRPRWDGVAHAPHHWKFWKKEHHEIPVLLTVLLPMQRLTHVQTKIYKPPMAQSQSWFCKHIWSLRWKRVGIWESHYLPNGYASNIFQHVIQLYTARDWFISRWIRWTQMPSKQMNPRNAENYDGGVIALVTLALPDPGWDLLIWTTKWTTWSPTDGTTLLGASIVIAELTAGWIPNSSSWNQTRRNWCRLWSRWRNRSRGD